MAEILKEAAEDSIRLLPFLLITYIIMELAERRAKGRTARAIADAGRGGPIIGAALGLFPQCGFSAAASNFYGAGLIGMGTLIAVFMSTSDEMLPVFIAEKVSPERMAKILAAKFIIACITGIAVSAASRRIFAKRR